MCGRCRLKDPKAAFDWLGVVPTFEARSRFNIAPTQRVPVVTDAGRVEEMVWGIVPAWAKETSKALINARSESVREKRSFKSSFQQRRCLVPADGFYEWTEFWKHAVPASEVRGRRASVLPAHHRGQCRPGADPLPNA